MSDSCFFVIYAIVGFQNKKSHVQILRFFTFFKMADSGLHVPVNLPPPVKTPLITPTMGGAYVTYLVWYLSFAISTTNVTPSLSLMSVMFADVSKKSKFPYLLNRLSYENGWPLVGKVLCNCIRKMRSCCRIMAIFSPPTTGIVCDHCFASIYPGCSHWKGSCSSRRQKGL